MKRSIQQPLAGARALLLKNRPWAWKLALAAALLAAFGLRMINLTNPPLDFNPTRQLFSALKARGMYLRAAVNVPESQRELGIALGQTGIVEPPVL